jgi:hypothetical protein
MHSKKIKNTLHGYHLNSSYWQTYKQTLPKLPKHLQEIAFGMILGDAGVTHVSKHASMKFEQGYKQKDFVFTLFDLFQSYCFMERPSVRYTTQGNIKSYWFKTFSFPCFTELYNLFYKSVEGQGVRKTIPKGLLTRFLTPTSLTYWIMCDGSLQNDGQSLVLHTQSYTLEENRYLSHELNALYQLHTRVIAHKTKYWVVFIPSQDSKRINKYISKEMLACFRYKIPSGNQRKVVNDIV